MLRAQGSSAEWRCLDTLPRLELRCRGTEQVKISGTTSTQYNLSVANWTVLSDQIFDAAPELPACGLNTNSSRSWVRIVDGDFQQHNGYCAFDEASDVEDINFKVPQGEVAPIKVRVEIEDRFCGDTYFSNWINLTECGVAPPFDLSIAEVKLHGQAGEQLQVDVFMGLGLFGETPDGIHTQVLIFEGRDETELPLAIIPVDVEANGAITCAVTCAGECPSIFGDGVCTGCSCNYNNWLSTTIPNPRAQVDYFLKIEGVEGESLGPDQDPTNDTLIAPYNPPPPPPFDLSVKTARFIPLENGDLRIHALVELAVEGELPNGIQARIEFFEGEGLAGFPFEVGIIDVEPVNSAITCAVTCAGECPSIFGDGVCTGCGCKYNNWFSATIPGGSEAQVDYFLKIEGVDGESLDANPSNDSLRVRYDSSGKPNPNPPWNRSVMGVGRDALGNLDIEIGLGLADTSNDRLDLSFDIEIFEKGELTLTIPVEVVKNDAIWCAVTCAGACPSIFGDGVCTGCGCDYSNSFAAPTDPSLGDDEIVVILRPAPGALPELPGFGDDDEGRPGSSEECRVDPASGATIECFRRGDASANGVFDFTDGVWILEFLFLGTKEIGCMDAADFNDTGAVDLNDAIDALKHIFLGAAPPAAPGAESCGADPTEDGLEVCEYFASCGS